MTTFGSRLLTCIEERKTSQAEVARRAGISGASVSDWATDKTQPENIKAEPLLKAAAYLYVHPQWLLFGKGQREVKLPQLHIAEPSPAPYAGWPFEALDYDLIRQLRPHERHRVEGAWILAAKQLGFSLAKPDSA